ncbi:MAG: hypothetical protein Q8M76_01940, partial [Spirochaetaceae bacterium]|nr:hypothetical protein [Spirochaetaceae bacterium]
GVRDERGLFGQAKMRADTWLGAGQSLTRHQGGMRGREPLPPRGRDGLTAWFSPLPSSGSSYSSLSNTCFRYVNGVYWVMEFIETSVFTKLIDALLDAEQYRALQDALTLRSEAGDLIPGTKGLRKIRWGAEGRGKRGGLRVIYYYKNDRGQI